MPRGLIIPRSPFPVPGSLFLVLFLLGPSASADKPPSSTIDWERGLLIVKTVGTADRRAPSPAVARVSSRTEAESRAAERLIAAALALPQASGGTVDDAIDAGALAGLPAVELATDLLADGSVRITRGLPIEAIAAALSAPRTITPDWGGGAAAPAGPTAIVVDARNLGVTPGVGIAVTDGSTTTRMPALYVTKSPKDDDPRLGARPERAKASSYSAGLLTVPSGTPLDPGALLVVISEPP
jgi:hypothetical protein